MPSTGAPGGKERKAPDSNAERPRAGWGEAAMSLVVDAGTGWSGRSAVQVHDRRNRDEAGCVCTHCGAGEQGTEMR